MARIVVIMHEYDEFSRRERFWRPVIGNYMLFDVLRALARRGHRWKVVAGPRRVPGDVAILHVDSTRVGEEYLALAAHYRASVNFKAVDISKRCVSRGLLAPGDAWRGEVIIKSDLNFAGAPEGLHNMRAARAGAPPPHPQFTPIGEYRILPSIAEVPDEVWEDPSLVVERFTPEPDEQGYAMRTWVFMGQRERCMRRVSAHPLVKATNCISRTPAAVPDALRAERARLGFDYGKFDFVIHDGEPVLLDANRTPGRPPGSDSVLAERAALWADGLEDFL